MFRLTSYLLVAAAALALTAVAVAAPPDALKCATLERATHLIGMDVQNPMGKPVGALRDIVLEPTGDRISYGVLIYGAPAKYLAVPWESFSLKFDGSALVLATPQAALDKAPGFDPAASYPDQGDPLLAPAATIAVPPAPADLETPLDETPTEETPNLEEPISFPMIQSTAAYDASTRQLGRLFGSAVRNARGEDLGTVEDFVVDVANGQVLYAVARYTGPTPTERKMAPIPYDRITFVPDDRTARVEADLKAFDAVAFTDNWPDFANADYTSRINAEFRAAAERPAPVLEVPKFEPPAPTMEELLEPLPPD